MGLLDYLREQLNPPNSLLDRKYVDKYQEWQPEAKRVGGQALEAPMFAPDDLIGTGIPSKLATLLAPALKTAAVGAAPLATMGLLSKAAEQKGVTTVANKLAQALDGQAGMFLGKGAKTADLAKLAQAESRIAAGDDAAKVWAETGWGKGPDGHWRFEIPDNKAFYRGSKAAESTYADDVYLHPELYKNYQGLGNKKIKEIPGDQGYWSETAVGIGDKNASSIAAHEFQHGVQGREGFARGGSPDEFNPKAAENARDVLNWRREVEQWMQKNWPNAKPDTETLMNADQRVRDSYGAIGAYDLVPPIDVRNQAINPSFKTGSADRSAMEQMVKEFGLDQKTTPDSAKKMYSRLAGEAEARLTQSRMNMDAAQRAAQYPWQADYFQQATGVPLNGLLFRYD